jgi:hypothetical protein
MSSALLIWRLFLLLKGLRKAYVANPNVYFTMLGIQRLEAFAQCRKDTDRRGYNGVEMAVMTDRIKELKEYKRAKVDLLKSSLSLI